MVMEAYLRYHSSFVTSSSNFWHHPTWKRSFVAIIVNLMVHGYNFKKPKLFLACSDTTLTKIKSNDLTNELLQTPIATLHRLQGLIEFFMYLKQKTGRNIAILLEKSHLKAAIKPDFMGGHCVDNAGNALKSNEELRLSTLEARL